MNKSKLTIALLAATAALSSCSNIAEDDRFIELPAIEIPATQVPRVVLLEEFTGQMCVNCPEAHKIIEGLQEQYGHQLISVSIHAGGDAFSLSEDLPGNMGLRTNFGEELAAAYNIKSFPSGIVDRNSGVLNKDQWAAAIRSDLEKGSDLEIKLNAALDGSDIKISAEILPNVQMTGHMQVWIVENSIIAPQIQIDGSMTMDYPHNHVFRASATSLEGAEVKLEIIEETGFEDGVFVTNIVGVPAVYNFSIAKAEKWVASNLAVVAFVYTDKGVQQAAICNVGSPE